MGRGGGSYVGEKDHILVFAVSKEATCDECGVQLFGGNLIRVENGLARCMECADLSHLVFLPAGDAALTRRSTKHSRLSAVVLRWSRARKRYERQGILVEGAALAQAEEECLSDADRRKRRRASEAECRDRLDRQYLADFAAKIKEQFPGCPQGAELEIATHTCEKYSGRVGRSAAAKALDPESIELAARAHIRHRYTPYDEHLMTGWSRDDARAAVRQDVEEVLRAWSRVAIGRIERTEG
jgi:hypothetical protein